MNKKREDLYIFLLGSPLNVRIISKMKFLCGGKKKENKTT